MDDLPLGLSDSPFHHFISSLSIFRVFPVPSSLIAQTIVLVTHKLCPSCYSPHSIDTGLCV